MSDYNPKAFAISATLFVEKQIPQETSYERLRQAFIKDGDPKITDQEIFAICDGKGMDKTLNINAEVRALINEHMNRNSEAGG